MYAAGTLSLAAIEYLVHIDPGDAPNDLIATTLDVPDDVIREIVKVADFPEAGDAWLLRARSLVLEVPSAPISGESNYLLNPAHAAMSRVQVVGKRTFVFDWRLTKH